MYEQSCFYALYSPIEEKSKSEWNMWWALFVNAIQKTCGVKKWLVSENSTRSLFIKLGISPLKINTHSHYIFIASEREGNEKWKKLFIVTEKDNRSFPHSCEQAHQLEVWDNNLQRFVWNCPPKRAPHFAVCAQWIGRPEVSIMYQKGLVCAKIHSHISISINRRYNMAARR